MAGVAPLGAVSHRFNFNLMLITLSRRAAIRQTTDSQTFSGYHPFWKTFISFFAFKQFDILDVNSDKWYITAYAVKLLKNLCFWNKI